MTREFYTKEEKQNHIALWETSGMTRHEELNKRGDILQVAGKKSADGRENAERICGNQAVKN